MTGVSGTAGGETGTGDGLPWSLWRRQIAAVLRIELKKSFVGRRAVMLYVLALLPISVLLLFGLAPMDWRESESLGFAAQVHSVVYQSFSLRFVVYFACVWLFTNLFRGEILDRSLHYYFLTPLRREVLVVGKFLSALAGTVVLFCGMTVVSYLLIYLPYGFGQARQHLFDGPGLGQLAGYTGVTALACLGYGALFLLIGLLFRNPILPAAVVLVWELVGFLLPPLLKKLSVAHYLKALVPLPMAEGPFALVAEPPPAWASTAGLALLAAVVLALAGLRVRRLEITYEE